MSLWGRVFAMGYDRVFARSEAAGLADLRAGVLDQVSGRVLEIGAGTGLNLEHYPHTGITSLVLTEPDPPMARRLEERAAGVDVDVEVVRAPAEALPFADASFDYVVCTLVLCSVGEVGQVLAEVRRVLAPGGQLLFLEHVRHPEPRRARLQDHFTPVQRRIACGCHLNRDTPSLIAAAGFAVTGLRHETFPKGPSVIQPLAIGTATP